MHTTRPRSTSTHGVIPITASIASTYTASCFFATPALALPPAVNDVAISVVTDPATSFVAGCATGAIIAGLMVSLASRGTKKRLQEQLAETMDALQRAEAATHAAEQLMHEMQLEMGVLNGQPYSPFDYVGNVKLSDTASYGEQEAAARGQVTDTQSGSGSNYDPYADGNVGEDTQAYDTARENGFDVPAEVAQARQARQAQPMARAAQEMAESQVSATGSAQAPSSRQATGASPSRTGAHLRTNATTSQPVASKAAPKASQTASSAPTSGRRGLGATGQSVAGRLAERYGRAGKDAIVIERAKVLEDTRPQARVVQAAPTMRYFDPKKRADAINRRVPRLDESLFPDMTAISSHDEDAFATAMRAMDRAMGPQQAIPYAPGAPSPVGYPSDEAYPAPAYTPSATGYQNAAGYRGTTGVQGTVGYQSAAGFQGTQDIQGTKGLGVTRGDLIAASTPLVVDEQDEHVDELIREEFEINRSGASRRYSRSKLTMIDGGERTGSTRRGGRHFANVS